MPFFKTQQIVKILSMNKSHMLKDQESDYLWPKHLQHQYCVMSVNTGRIAAYMAPSPKSLKDVDTSQVLYVSRTRQRAVKVCHNGDSRWRLCFVTLPMIRATHPHLLSKADPVGILSDHYLTFHINDDNKTTNQARCVPDQVAAIARPQVSFRAKAK